MAGLLSSTTDMMSDCASESCALPPPPGSGGMYGVGVEPELRTRLRLRLRLAEQRVEVVIQPVIRWRLRGWPRGGSGHALILDARLGARTRRLPLRDARGLLGARWLGRLRLHHRRRWRRGRYCRRSRRGHGRRRAGIGHRLRPGRRYHRGGRRSGRALRIGSRRRHRVRGRHRRGRLGRLGCRRRRLRRRSQLRVLRRPSGVGGAPERQEEHRAPAAARPPRRRRS